ncbi:Aste57867_7968 [Aphanomyces stellatus]|uniref:Aste57867_7968 protein n=1 Tax=Aphanomyces stellatus TaxID=120398 RepID=A0A485KJ42_9STRA|nr:hypothetical protein As57867_007938 [Aphanomyces stellatus]VFT84861.1 Aste57867_7968 [Aphanomyces stellatus]
MLPSVLVAWIATIALPAYVAASNMGSTPPRLPLYFETDLEIFSHLIDASASYPPALRKMKIRYDYTQGLARADILAGYDKGKSYIRRYDSKREYKVRYGKYKNCERAYLGEEMPIPDLPRDLVYQGNQHVLGQECELWSFDIPHTLLRIHVFESVDTQVPMRLTQESQDDVGDWLPVITYDFVNLKVEPQVRRHVRPVSHVFSNAQEMKSFDIPGGYTHDTCTRSVVGFPYIHIFEHYLRF